jgi:CDP-diacylglycerol--glycerol-3-phosphate 3-phosphatidyltransferase
MAFVPAVVATLFLRTDTGDQWAAWLFVAASVTDYFDGYLARKQKVVTVYGKLMDPLADKFLVVSSLIMLQEMGRIHPVVVMLLICREMAITGLRALASAEGLIISASDSAKWKTATQMTAIPFIMGRHLGPIPLETTGNVLLYASLGMSLWSAKDYIVGFFRAIRKKRELKSQERKHARAARLAARADRLAAKAAKAARNRGEPTTT